MKIKKKNLRSTILTVPLVLKKWQKETNLLPSSSVKGKQYLKTNILPKQQKEKHGKNKCTLVSEIGKTASDIGSMSPKEVIDKLSMNS